ncbi:isochorismatase family protein, partial [Escherichia coli]|uniref:isochorismatase family protein n=1 Tax=Escherichia coli TaxID=562 RepID=UPI002034741C
KRQWGAFYGTDLELQLRRRGIDTIVLCGISTNIGVESTARNAMPDGFTPVDFDITYDCGDTSKIKNSLQMRIDGTTGVVD